LECSVDVLPSVVHVVEVELESHRTNRATRPGDTGCRHRASIREVWPRWLPANPTRRVPAYGAGEQRRYRVSIRRTDAP
jgi:hypothetical protein